MTSKVNFIQERTLKLLNKDFNGFKKDLIKFSQAHHSGVFQDFNESSPGMAILEMQAAVGDSLSFYLDNAFLELKHDTARQVENVAGFAKSLGYKPQGKAAAHAIQTFLIEIPAISNQGIQIPDPTYSPILRKGAQLQGPNGIFFETLDDINFSTSSLDSPRQVTGSRFDSISGLPTFFAVRKDVEIIAGQTITETFAISDFKQFLQIDLTNQDVLEIISAIDSDGNQYYEVDFLAQDTIFDSTVNTDEDNSIVPYVLKLLPVPRRFISDRNPSNNITSLIFGSGDGINFDDELIPNLADLALPLAGRNTFTSFPLDPQNFLKTRSLGISPYNTSLTVTYRVGGGDQTIVPPGSIKNISQAILDFSTTGLDAVKKGTVISSLETINVGRSSGGRSEETIPEIKANAAAFFAAQNRCVTPEDIIARVLSLPAKFGRPEKVFVKKTNTLINAFSLDVHILSKDADGHLVQATTTLSNNIRKYVAPFKMLQDGLNILQTDIINLKLDFGIVVSPKLNRTETLTKCLSVVSDYLDITKWSIGEPIVLSDLASTIQNVFGVISVYKLQFKNVFCPQFDENGYSTVRFDVAGNTSNSILFCPDNAIFECKFPGKDITGAAK